MPFLILTRAGFDDVAAHHALSGTTLYLNPAVASADEIALLRNAGAEIQILASVVNPNAPDEVLDAVRQVETEAGPPVWLERGTRSAIKTAPAAPAAPDDSAAGPRHQALHARLTDTASAFVGGAWRRLERHLGGGTQLVVLPYIGFGNAQTLSVRGRVLEDEGFKTQSQEDSRWSNLLELYKRLESDEVTGARVRARFQGQEYEAVTDRGGYFGFDIAPPHPLANGGWHSVEVDLPEHPGPDGAPVHATAEVLVPPASARFGVISDIDDTVLWTNVTNKFNMALMLARSNAHTRKPFKGVAAFYRALQAGVGGNENNPVFYVSSSPWHLFGPLLEFFRLQGIPVGPLMLRELGVRQILKLTEHHNHKLDKIEAILRLYPELQFILIGDSGEQDPEIYTEVVRRHPKSVRVIYIRNVNPDPARIEALDRLIAEVSATGTQLILSPDSEFAAAHAAAEGLIHVDGMALVRSEKKEDGKAGS